MNQTTDNPIDWARFQEVVDAANTIILTSHIRPDCDALGSELGMAMLLEQKGKQVRIVNGHATPPNLAFIDPENRIQTFGEDVQGDEINDADLLIVLDTSAWAQLLPMQEWIQNFPGKKAIVDHHVSEDDLGAELFKNTTAEATGRLVVECADALGCKITPEMAMPIFAAVATDTGWFRFPSASHGTYQVGSRLVEAGASPAGIYSELYERETGGRIRLRGRVLSRIAVELDGKLAHTYILKDDYEETGALPTDTEDLVNHCMEINGVEFAVIMIEQTTGGFKISFRSRCDVACNEVAGQFDGGGHKAAAGAFVKGEFQTVQPNVLDYVREQLNVAV